MKYLIVGLGNIGNEYVNTRHNIGFDILDALAKMFNATFSSARYGDIATVKWKGRTLILLKPSTYMNLSGNAVNYWLQHEKLDQEKMLVVLDDLALNLGAIRLRSKGNDGGHNGLKHIAQILGNANYNRLRFGIGNQFAQGQQVDFVLGKWTKEELLLLEPRIEIAIQAILSISSIGMDRTMNSFNGK